MKLKWIKFIKEYSSRARENKSLNIKRKFLKNSFFFLNAGPIILKLMIVGAEEWIRYDNNMRESHDLNRESLSKKVDLWVWCYRKWIATDSYLYG